MFCGEAVRWLPLWGQAMDEIKLHTRIRGLRCGDVMAGGDNAVIAGLGLRQ
jgi:hypothetical protein